MIFKALKVFIIIIIYFCFSKNVFFLLFLFYSFISFYVFCMEDHYDGLVNSTFGRQEVKVTKKGKENLMSYGSFLINGTNVKKNVSLNTDYIFLYQE